MAIPTGLSLHLYLSTFSRPFSLPSNWTATLCPVLSEPWSFREPWCVVGKPSPERLGDLPKDTQLVSSRTGWLSILLEDASPHLFAWVPPRPSAHPGEPRLGRDECSLHTCGAYQASVASQGFAMGPVFRSLHWTWSCWKVRVLVAFLAAAPVTAPHPGPELGPSNSLLSERGDVCGPGKETDSGRWAFSLGGNRARVVQEGGGDVCGNRTYKTGRWPDSFRLALERALLTEPAEILRTESQRHLPREVKGDRPGGASRGRIRHRRH